LVPTLLEEWSHIEHAEELHTTQISKAAVKGNIVLNPKPIKSMTAGMLKDLVDAMGGEGTRRRLASVDRREDDSSVFSRVEQRESQRRLRVVHESEER
jgi:hypothetical protein